MRKSKGKEKKKIISLKTPKKCHLSKKKKPKAQEYTRMVPSLDLSGHLALKSLYMLNPCSFMMFFCLLLVFFSRLWNYGEIHHRRLTTCPLLRQQRKWSPHLKIHDALARVPLA
jgi:hypothetical protein